MTRLPAAGGVRRPLRRLATGGEQVGELVVDMDERGFTLRPVRSRRPEAVVRLSWGGTYAGGLLIAIEERKRATRRGRRRVR